MQEFTRRQTLAAAAAGAATYITLPASAQVQGEAIEINLNDVQGPLEHIWSRCAGSDRAAISMREQWRDDLSRFHREAGLERIRFHAIFADELGVWLNGGLGATAEPNFQNVDAVYDGLMARGVQPFVELSFMPGRLASGTGSFGFYRANTSPPASVQAWGDFIATFARHLIERYGAAEVRQWYFEVWNEPNLPFFWAGTQAQYFELYQATALALKSVDPALKVGGPATSAVSWIPQFLDFCATNNVPLDFVATHAYAGDNQATVFGQGAARLSQNDVIPAAAAQVRAQINASRFRNMPFWLTEWSSDSPAMIAHIIAGCLPHCQGLSQWTISSTYEELMVASYILKEGNNGWGMMAQRGIAKPAFNTYKLLHRLGDQRLQASGPALASRRGRSAAALIWNLAEVNQPAGIPDATAIRTVNGAHKSYAVNFRGARRGQRVRATYVDMVRASPFPAWRALGSPLYPNAAEIARIRAAAELGPPQTLRLSASGSVTIELPPEGVALLELD